MIDHVTAELTARMVFTFMVYCELVTDGLTIDVCAEVARHCTVRAVAEGEELLGPGDVPDTFFMVFQGELAEDLGSGFLLEELGPNGGARYLPGMHLGGEHILLRRKPRARVVAAAPSLLLQAKGPAFYELLNVDAVLRAEFSLALLEPSKVTLDAVLCHPAALRAFQDHQSAELSVEASRFWLDAKAFKDEAEGMRPEQVRAKAQELFKVYLEEGAEQQVNVPAQIVAAVAKALAPHDGANAEFAVNEMTETPFTANVFEPARKEVHELMRKDTLPRFVASDRFVALRRQLRATDQPVATLAFTPGDAPPPAAGGKRGKRAGARGSVFISAPVRPGGADAAAAAANGGAAAPAAPAGKRAPKRGSVIARQEYGVGADGRARDGPRTRRHQADGAGRHAAEVDGGEMGGGARGGDGALAAVGLPGFGRRRGGGADRCRRRRARAPEFRGRARVAQLGMSEISSLPFSHLVSNGPRLYLHGRSIH